MIASHPQLTGLVAAEKDFTGGNDPYDDVGHGTMVALQSLRSAEEARRQAKAAGNEIRPSVASFLNAKVTSMTAPPTKGALMAAMQWAGDQGAKIVNISVGLRGQPEEFTELCDLVARTDAVFYAAAGEINDEGDLYPAQCTAPNLAAVDSAGTATGTATIQAESDIALVFDQPEYLFEEGRRAAQEGDYALARRQLEESLRMRPTPDAHFHLSTIDFAEKRVASSEEHLRKALALNPDHVSANAQLGSVLLQTGRAAEAIPHLRKAIERGARSPDLIPYRINLAIALVRTQKFDEGRAELERVLQDDPGNRSASELLDDLRATLAQRRD